MSIKMLKNCGIGNGRTAKQGQRLDDLDPEVERELIRMGRAEAAVVKKPAVKSKESNV